MRAHGPEFRVYNVEILRYEIPAQEQEPRGGQGKWPRWREGEGEAQEGDAGCW